jgi:hypothetical protein
LQQSDKKALNSNKRKGYKKTFIYILTIHMKNNKRINNE